MMLRTALVGLLLSGCSGAVASVDGGGDPTDAGGDGGLSGFDGGSADAGPADAGAIDAGPYDAGTAAQHQVARPLGSTSAPNGFYEYLPPHYEDGVPRPLLFFWHGIGEDGNGGSELTKLLGLGPPKLVSTNQWPLSRPFIVLSPQHAGLGCPSKEEIHAFITWALTQYRVDPKQVFQTAVSCGAIGSWDYLGSFTDSQLAAVVLISGDPGDPTTSSSSWGRAGCNLGKVAIWALHAQYDFVVSINNEQATMPKLIACPQPPRQDAIFTVVPNAFHDVWNTVYTGSQGDVFAWLLAHPKP